MTWPSRRKTRSGRKFVHIVEGASEPELEAYKERNREALDDPFVAIADFFTNKPGTIQAIDGDARLAEYDDVMHHVRTFWLASPIAMSLLGYGQDLNRDVLEEQKEQYDQAVEQITEWVETDIVVPILELAMAAGRHLAGGPGLSDRLEVEAAHVGD